MNKLRRITLATLAGGVAAGFGFKSLAHVRDVDRLDRLLKHFYVEIDATEAQKQQLEPIAKQAANDLLPLRERLHAGRREAIELLTQERVDAAALEALRARQIALADEASRTLTRTLSQAAEVLTPEQRKHLAARFARRHARWHG